MPAYKLQGGDVWVPEELLMGTPETLAAHINGTLYVPQRSRLTKDTPYDSDSDPNNEIPIENLIIEAFSIFPYPFNIDNNSEMENSFMPPSVHLIGVTKDRSFRHPNDRSIRYLEVETGSTFRDATRYRLFTVK